MPTILGIWGNFEAGHWGNLGPEQAAANQWGGINMVLTPTGGLATMNASRPLPLSGVNTGPVRGMFWAWGVDGLVYYVQDNLDATRVYRFNPDPTNIPAATTSIGSVATPTYEPDWVGIGTTLYLTVWGASTYTINTAVPSIAVLTGSYTTAPAGRCIALYGERLVVGGVSDSRFGTHANRIVFSGDDTGNNPTDKTAWEALNYFDLGADGTPITALYPTRDNLIVVLQDQQVYLISGVLGSTAIARRIYGFHKGSGGVTSYVAANGAVDPDQSRLWFFNHKRRGLASITGTQFADAPIWGIPHADRTASDVFEGTMAMIGGPGEFVMCGVAAARTAGESVIGKKLDLIRAENAFALADRDVIGLRST